VLFFVVVSGHRRAELVERASPVTTLREPPAKLGSRRTVLQILANSRRLIRRFWPLSPLGFLGFIRTLLNAPAYDWLFLDLHCSLICLTYCY
jgi:hypothetical protein